MTEAWVKERLYDILGISDKYIAQFFVALAQKASDEDDFVQRLKDTGTVDVDPPLITFAKELWGKVPHKQKVVRGPTQEQLAQKELEHKNRTYQLVEEDDDFLEPLPKKIKKMDREKSSKRNIRKRKEESESSSESEKEEAAAADLDADSAQDSDSEDEDEKERLADLKERDDFAKRLVDKDKTKTNIVSKSEKKATRRPRRDYS